MNCRDCQTQLADLSAEVLSEDQLLAMREHFAECAHCNQEWAVFERTLFVVSTTQQTLPSPLASQQMWNACAEHIFQKIEAERATQSRQAPLEYSRPNAQNAPPARGWFARQPRWSWGALAGAFAVLGAVLLASPRENVSPNNEPFQPEGELVALKVASVASSSFQNPSRATASLVNHHSAMSIDPFTDYVGTTLVSYSATSPSDASPVKSSRTQILPRR